MPLLCLLVAGGIWACNLSTGLSQLVEDVIEAIETEPPPTVVVGTPTPDPFAAIKGAARQDLEQIIIANEAGEDLPDYAPPEAENITEIEHLWGQTADEGIISFRVRAGRLNSAAVTLFYENDVLMDMDIRPITFDPSESRGVVVPGTYRGYVPFGGGESWEVDIHNIDRLIVRVLPDNPPDDPDIASVLVADNILGLIVHVYLRSSSRTTTIRESFINANQPDYVEIRPQRDTITQSDTMEIDIRAVDNLSSGGYTLEIIELAE